MSPVNEGEHLDSNTCKNIATTQMTHLLLEPESQQSLHNKRPKPTEKGQVTGCPTSCATEHGGFSAQRVSSNRSAGGEQNFTMPVGTWAARQFGWAHGDGGAYEWKNLWNIWLLMVIVVAYGGFK